MTLLPHLLPPFQTQHFHLWPENIFSSFLKKKTNMEENKCRLLALYSPPQGRKKDITMTSNSKEKMLTYPLIKLYLTLIINNISFSARSLYEGRQSNVKWSTGCLEYLRMEKLWNMEWDERWSLKCFTITMTRTTISFVTAQMCYS